MKKYRIPSIAITVILVILAAYTLFPFYMAVLNSFKTQAEMYRSVLAFPKVPTLENFGEAIGKLDFFRSLYNTAYITVVSIAGIIILGSLAGYVLSRTKGKLSSFIFSFFVFSMMVPFFSIMVRLITLINDIHIRGTKTGLCAIYVGLGVPMAIFLYHGFVKSVPQEIEESAIVDGCGPLNTFIRVVFPLLKPITATVAILDVLWIWNDYLLPSLTLGSVKNNTLVIGSMKFFDQYNTEWSNVVAALTLVTIPIVVFYFFFQKYIISGLTSGALKG